MVNNTDEQDYQDYKDYNDYQDYQKKVAAWQPEPYEPPHSVMGGIVPTLQKGLDLIGSAVKVPLAAAYGGVTGHPVMSTDEMKTSLNPLTWQRSPDYDKLMARDNIPNSTWDWDKINPPVINPNTDQPRPRITDILPHSVGGVADMALNPINWPGAARVVGMGGKALTPSEVALKAAPGAEASAVMNMPKGGPSIANQLVQRLSNSPLVNPISATLRILGNKLYGSAVDPVLTQGVKVGKEAQPIIDTLYNYGIKSPSNMVENVAAKNAKVMSAVNGITHDPALQIAPDIETSLQKAQDFVDKYAAIKDPEVQAVARKMQERLDGIRKIAKGEPGVPAVPPSTQQIATPMGGGVMRSTVQVPGSPGIPGVPPNPSTIGDLQLAKQAGYKLTPTSAYSQVTKTPLEQEFEKILNNGRKTTIEDSLNQVSPGIGDKVEAMNADVGNSTSTKRGQATADAQFTRTANSAVNPTKGLKKLGAMLGGVGGMAKGMALEGANALSMPLGYGMRATGESQLSPLLDMAAKQYIINNANKGAGQ